jgi:hypothetical protein
LYILSWGKRRGKGCPCKCPHPSDFALPLKDWPSTKGNPEKIFAVITKGIPNSVMAGWPQLSDKERWGLVYRVMEFSVPSGKKGK